MDRAEAIRRLREREVDLRAYGIENMAIFGSTARGEQRPDSDVDLVVRFATGVSHAWGWFWIQDEVAAMLGAPVDMVSEPIRKPRLRAQIERDRVDVF